MAPRIVLGTLIGFASPLLLFTILFEHNTLFFLIPVLPIMGIVIGILLGLFQKIPKLKVWISLLLFTTTIGITLGYSAIRQKMLKTAREQFAITLVHQYSNNKIIDVKYNPGNGLETPPNVLIFVKSDDSFEEIANFFENSFQENGWHSRKSGWFLGKEWEKQRTIVYYNNRAKEMGEADFWMSVDFNNYWLRDLFHPLHLS